MKLYIGITICFLSAQIYADEYLYPVGCIQQYGRKQIYLIYQKSIEHLELLLWDPVTNETTKGLLSTFNPAGFQILPDKSGFSFIDNGRIRIKSFNKRSPKSVALYYPIDDINIINWVDATTFYFMGKEGVHYGIFQANHHGDVVPIINDNVVDYLYPQKIGNKLFFIRRSDGNYAICCTSYPSITYEDWLSDDDEETFKKHVSSLLNEKESLIRTQETNVVVNLKTQHIAFLTMVSDQEGFFIEHPGTIERSHTLIHFTYHRLFKGHEAWNTEPLFQFSLPAQFFIGDTSMRIYESLLPFLPRLINRTLFFVHCDDSDHLKTNLFSFNLEGCVSCRRSPEISSELFGTTFFSPLYTDPMVFYGGRLSTEFSGKLPLLYINEHGILCAEIPFIIES